MSSPESDPRPRRRSPGGYSPDCDDVFFDGPSNVSKTEPRSPAALEAARASREKLIRYGAIKVPPSTDAGTPSEAAPSPSNGTAPKPNGTEADNGVIRVPLDAALLLRLHGLSQPVELIDASGKVVARVTPTVTGAASPGPAATS